MDNIINNIEEYLGGLKKCVHIRINNLWVSNLEFVFDSNDILSEIKIYIKKNDYKVKDYLIEEESKKHDKKVESFDTKQIEDEVNNEIEFIIEPNDNIKNNIINKENLLGMWESQNNKKQYQLLIYNRDDNSFDFQFYDVECLEINGINDISLYGFTGTAKFIDKEIAEFKIDDSLLVNYYSSVEGSIKFINNTIQISYKYESHNKVHIIELTKVRNEDIIKKSARLPFYYRELSIMGEPIYNISISNAYDIFGEPLEHYENEYIEVRSYNGYEIKFTTPTEYNASSMIIAIKITKPGIPIIRGIEVGDDIRDVINKFPYENNEIISEYGELYLPLYGKAQHPGNFGQIMYEKGKPIRVKFSELGYLSFELDSNLRVASISFILP
ncbi:MAG: hypothetical protein N4A50_04245 [Vallitalea sp.]|jgi:hypothetical protein|nr:hypothetical protein [Vallitalea sp.]